MSRGSKMAALLKRRFVFKEKEEIDEKNRPLVNALGITLGSVLIIEVFAIALSARYGPAAGLRATGLATAIVALVGSWARLQAHSMPDEKREARWLLDGFGKGVNFIAGMATVAFAVFALQVV